MKVVKISNLHQYVGYKVVRNIYIGDGIAYLSSGSIEVSWGSMAKIEKKPKTAFFLRCLTKQR